MDDEIHPKVDIVDLIAAVVKVDRSDGLITTVVVDTSGECSLLFSPF